MSSKAAATTPLAPAPKVKCHCGRHFKSNEALEQHQRDKPNHPEPRKQPIGTRDSCPKLVRDEKGTAQHRPTAQERKKPEQFSTFSQGERPGLGRSTGYSSGRMFFSDPSARLYQQPIRFVQEGQASNAETKNKRKTKNKSKKTTASTGAESRGVWSAYGKWWPDVGDDHGLCDKDCGWCGHCADDCDVDF